MCGQTNWSYAVVEAETAAFARSTAAAQAGMLQPLSIPETHRYYTHSPLLTGRGTRFTAGNFAPVLLHLNIPKQDKHCSSETHSSLHTQTIRQAMRLCQTTPFTNSRNITRTFTNSRNITRTGRRCPPVSHPTVSCSSPPACTLQADSGWHVCPNCTGCRHTAST